MHVSTSTTSTRFFNSDHQRRLRTLLASGATALLGILSACTAYIDGADGSHPANVGGPGSTVSPGSDPNSGTVDPLDPGRVTIRRLNRAEYNNTVRDLFGTQRRPADSFTDEGVGHGFDNAADSMAIAPAQMEKYSKEAEALATELLSGPHRATVVTCDPSKEGAACVRRIIADFGLRAFRRPLTDAEIAVFAGLYDSGSRDGGSSDVGLQLVLQAMLISPHFLFMVELDPAPQSTEPHPVGSFELATRLSHFLWSSTPDPQLLQSAATGSLSRSDALLEQVSRMLDDSHARALADNFAGQWFLFRDLTAQGQKAHQADPKIFPEWSPDLARSMQLETELVFRELVASAKSPLVELLTAGYTFVDQRLAQHYGLLNQFAAGQAISNPLPGEEGFKRIDLTGTPRRGILGQASLLTATSMADRTSPTKRGVFVLRDLLCTPPPDPPANVPLIPMDAEAGANAPKTWREKLALHTQKGTTCQACHSSFDPIGLGLEQFDALGRFRTQENGQTIPTAGEILGGPQFAGPSELISIIAADERAQRCAVQKLTAYALGRDVAVPGDAAEKTDGERVAYLTQQWRATGGTFRDLVRLIATSRAFQMRRGDPLPPDSTVPGGAP